MAPREVQSGFVRYGISPAGMSNYTVDGILVVSSIHWRHSVPLLREPHGAMTAYLLAGGRIQVHDEPNGLLGFKVPGETLTVTFPDTARITTIENAARVEVSGRVLLVRFDDGEWLDRTRLAVDGFGSFHLVPAAREGNSPEVQNAIAERRLGAQVAIRGTHVAPEVAVFAYDDVSVNVRHAATLATPEAPIEVRMEAELEEGRTVVLDIDPSLIPGGGRDLVLRYYTERDDGSRTEVVFAKASHLADILDPTDDAGQPEYWVTHDEDGLHVMVSVPHWSVHVVSVAGLLRVEPSVLVGLVAGAAATVLAAVAMFARRDDP